MRQASRWIGVALLAATFCRPPGLRPPAGSAPAAGPPATSGNGQSEIAIAHLGATGHRRILGWFGPQSTPEPFRIELATLAPLSAGSVFVPDLTELPAGAYAAVLQSEGATLGAIVRTEWPRSGGLAIGQAPRPSASEGAVVVPLIAKGWLSAATFLTLQAAGTEETATSQKFYVELVDGQSGAMVQGANTVVAGGWRSTTMSLGEDDPLGLPEGFRGWALVRSHEPAVAQAMLALGASSRGILALEGLPLADLGPDLYAPSVYLARRLAAGDTDRRLRHTVLVLVNVGSEPATATIRLVGRLGRCASRTADQTIIIAAGHQAWLGTWPADAEPLPLAADCGAAAHIHVLNGGPVVGVAIDVITDGVAANDQFAAYTLLAPPGLGRRLLLPSLRRSESGLTSAVVAMNVGLQPARATLRVVRADGEPNEDCGSACQAVIDPGAATVWSMARLPGIRSGFLGYGVIDSSQPLAVTVAEEPETGSGLDLALSNALPAQTTVGEPQIPTRGDAATGGMPFLPLVLNVAALPTGHWPTLPIVSPSPAATAASATPLATPPGEATAPAPVTPSSSTPTPPAVGARALFLPLARR